MVILIMGMLTTCTETRMGTLWLLDRQVSRLHWTQILDKLEALRKGLNSIRYSRMALGIILILFFNLIME